MQREREREKERDRGGLKRKQNSFAGKSENVHINLVSACSFRYDRNVSLQHVAWFSEKSGFGPSLRGQRKRIRRIIAVVDLKSW